MDIVVTSAGMRACDRYAIETFGLPSLLLMENAGRKVAQTASGHLRSCAGENVTIVCGTGNNGGDGFVAARHLHATGVNVRVVLVGRVASLKGDPRTNFDVIRNLARRGAARARLDIVVDPTGKSLRGPVAPDMIIDALFGTGFHGALRGGGLKAVEWINRQEGHVLSVDLPSGLDADNGSVANLCVHADTTVTMGLLKAGLLVGRGPAVSGKVIVAGLGVPMPDRRAEKEGVSRVTLEDMAAGLPARAFDAHKHSVGKILVVAGSVGFTGAAALTASAAMKSGAGAVILATPSSIYPVLARKLTEVMVKPVGGDVGGAFSAASLDSIGKEIEWADVVIVGPGIGLSPHTALFLEKLLKTTGKRFLLDADALTHIARKKGLRGILGKNRCILTPHSGEFSRLTGFKAPDIEANRIEFARVFAKKFKSTLILKGAPTVTADARGRVFINPTGNRGMATAGMGDVLSGIVGALWAESGDPVISSYAGVYLHGLAGDRVADRVGYRSLMARDVINEIPQTLFQQRNS